MKEYQRQELPKWYVSQKTGNKFAFGNPNHLHKSGVDTYANLGNGSTKDLPADQYPYIVEYEDAIKKVRK